MIESRQERRAQHGTCQTLPVLIDGPTSHQGFWVPKLCHSLWSIILPEKAKAKVWSSPCLKKIGGFSEKPATYYKHIYTYTYIHIRISHIYIYTIIYNFINDI
jgi:hypothetical protein